MDMEYIICLSNYEDVLPALACLIGADYRPGTFESITDKFHLSGTDNQDWDLVGQIGSISIKLEKHEGYFFSKFIAENPQYQQGKQLLWDHYLLQGGNPHAQQQP